MRFRVLRLLISHPDWVLEHVSAYAQLLQADLHRRSIRLGERLLGLAVAGIGTLSLVASLTAAGVALALQAPEAMHAPWLLGVVPLVSLGAVGWGLWRFMAAPPAPATTGLGDQWQQDLAWMRGAPAPGVDTSAPAARRGGIPQ